MHDLGPQRRPARRDDRVEPVEDALHGARRSRSTDGGDHRRAPATRAARPTASSAARRVDEASAAPGRAGRSSRPRRRARGRSRAGRSASGRASRRTGEPSGRRRRERRRPGRGTPDRRRVAPAPSPRQGSATAAPGRPGRCAGRPAPPCRAWPGPRPRSTPSARPPGARRREQQERLVALAAEVAGGHGRCPNASCAMRTASAELKRGGAARSTASIAPASGITGRAGSRAMSGSPRFLVRGFST